MKAGEQVNALYQLPLAEFTAARNALAKTRTGEAAKEVRALAKPTALPWAVNQVFWHARALYEQVLECGKSLRAAQLAALKGQKADVRSATAAHRTAIADAVRRAMELAAKQNVKPESEALARMFEALSLAAVHPGTPGRLIDVPQPQGFESLAGVAIKTAHGSGPRALPAAKPASGSGLPAAEEERRGERARQQAEEEVAKATRELERAKLLESAARRDVERATFALRRAEEALAAARKKLSALPER